jgi:multidrug efflux pump subunit AcrB
MSNPVEAVNLAFTKYTPVSVTSLAVFVCVVALVVTLAVVYGPKTLETLTDTKQVPVGPKVSTTSEDFTWSDFAAGLFTKYLGWSVTAIVVVVLLIGGIGFGSYKVHQYRTSAPQEAKALDDLVTKLNTLLDTSLPITDDVSYRFQGKYYNDYENVVLIDGSKKLKLNLDSLATSNMAEAEMPGEDETENEDKKDKAHLIKDLNKACRTLDLTFGPVLVTKFKTSYVEVVNMNIEKLREYFASLKNDEDHRRALTSLQNSLKEFEENDVREFAKSTSEKKKEEKSDEDESKSEKKKNKKSDEEPGALSEYSDDVKNKTESSTADEDSELGSGSDE